MGEFKGTKGNSVVVDLIFKNPEGNEKTLSTTSCKMLSDEIEKLIKDATEI